FGHPVRLPAEKPARLCGASLFHARIAARARPKVGVRPCAMASGQHHARASRLFEKLTPCTLGGASRSFAPERHARHQRCCSEENPVVTTFLNRSVSF